MPSSFYEQSQENPTKKINTTAILMNLQTELEKINQQEIEKKQQKIEAEEKIRKEIEEENRRISHIKKSEEKNERGSHKKKFKEKSRASSIPTAPINFTTKQEENKIKTTAKQVVKNNNNNNNNNNIELALIPLDQLRVLPPKTNNNSLESKKIANPLINDLPKIPETLNVIDSFLADTTIETAYKEGVLLGATISVILELNSYANKPTQKLIAKEEINTLRNIMAHICNNLTSADILKFAHEILKLKHYFSPTSTATKFSFQMHNVLLYQNIISSKNKGCLNTTDDLANLNWFINLAEKLKSNMQHITHQDEIEKNIPETFFCIATIIKLHECLKLFTSDFTKRNPALRDLLTIYRNQLAHPNENIIPSNSETLYDQQGKLDSFKLLEIGNNIDIVIEIAKIAQEKYHFNSNHTSKTFSNVNLLNNHSILNNEIKENSGKKSIFLIQQEKLGLEIANQIMALLQDIKATNNFSHIKNKCELISSLLMNPNLSYYYLDTLMPDTEGVGHLFFNRLKTTFNQKIFVSKTDMIKLVDDIKEKIDSLLSEVVIPVNPSTVNNEQRMKYGS